MTAARRKFGFRDLGRLALWGVCAISALSVAVYAGTTETGRNRLHIAFAEIHEILMPSGVEQVRPLDAREGRRLADTVRRLSGDRERLLARLASLEQSLDGVTGSVARVEKAVRPAEPPPEPSAPSVQAAAPSQDVTSSINPASPENTTPVPAQPSSVASKAEFGLDLGGASTVEALRTAWTIALRRHSTLLEGLRPIVHTRDRARPGSAEFRLIAGPLPNAAAAARLCAAMTAAGAICAPTAFDGQRLAGR
jgi:hypothetical protein